MTTDEKRGPLNEQLAQARRDAAERDAQSTLDLIKGADAPTLEQTQGTPDAAGLPGAKVTRRAPQVLREVRCGIVVETNMRHDPPPPAPEGSEVERRTAWRVYRRGVGRIA